MSQGVDKLKELLFDNEHRTLSELQERVDAVFERAGTEQRFQSSVADVLDGALRKAEVERHTELSQAVAPLVVQTIKTELHNSRDDLVEALYPITGRMVANYVSSAMKDLMNQVNRRLEQNPATLRIKSIMTGHSMAEIALAETQNLDIEEIYLMRRGSGELIARWPTSDGKSNQDHVMSGILTAINEFALEAFKADSTSLRTIDLGDACIYLRASPNHLLAAKCEGSAPASIERVIDQEFLNTIEKHKDALDNTENDKTDGILAELAKSLQAKISSKQAEIISMPLGIRPIRAVLKVIGLIIAGLIAWSLYQSYTTSRVRTVAANIIDTSSEIKGYPTRLDVAPYGTSITLAGLAPTQDAKSTVIGRLKSALPNTAVNNQLAVLPIANDAGPQIAELEKRLRDEAANRALKHALARLSQVRPDLVTLSSTVTGETEKSVATSARTTVKATINELQPIASSDTGSGEPLSTELTESLTERLQHTNRKLASLIGSATSAATPTLDPPIPTRPETPSSTDPQLLTASEQLANMSERLAALTLAATEAVLRRQQKAAPSSQELLEDWMTQNAVFFSTRADYRNRRQVKEQLDELADIVKQAGLLVRIVGYTDERGQDDRNTSLAQRRAAKVRNGLMSRGVPQRLLVAVGRRDTMDLSTATGEGSPNRRVEFELGFKGESAR